MARESDAAAGRLDPGAGIVLQAVWLDLGPQRAGRLLLVAHHLVVDGVSWAILIEDLATAWSAADDGRAVALEPVATSLRDWARSVSEAAARPELLADVEHWSAVTAPGAELVPGTIAEGTHGAARRRTLTLDARDLPARGVDDALLAALWLAVTRWRGRPKARCSWTSRATAATPTRTSPARSAG